MKNSDSFGYSLARINDGEVLMVEHNWEIKFGQHTEKIMFCVLVLKSGEESGENGEESDCEGQKRNPFK